MVFPIMAFSSALRPRTVGGTGEMVVEVNEGGAVTKDGRTQPLRTTSLTTRR